MIRESLKEISEKPTIKEEFKKICLIGIELLNSIKKSNGKSKENISEAEKNSRTLFNQIWISDDIIIEQFYQDFTKIRNDKVLFSICSSD